MSRAKKSAINIVVNIGYQIFTILMSFITRTIFIHVLGTEYLGINSLFTNILSVLSLAELGIGTAMVYCMYKPLANKDTEKLASLIQYFKVLYIRIACIVFIAGICLIPFLKYIINLESDIPNITLFYILYILDTVVSYLCVYKTSILTADQNTYVLKLYRMIFDVIRVILQVFVLLVLKNYIAYIIVQISCSVVNNIFSARYVNKKYSYINKKVDPIEKQEKALIWKNIKAIFSYKIGGVILNNTDQLLISSLISTKVVGLYSNYYMPINAVMGITSSVFIGLQASIGNLAVESNEKRQYEIFNILNICSFWLYGFFTICFCVLLQDFIKLWIGEKYLLSNSLVYIISCTYYLTGVLYPIWCYRETVGLFQHTRNIMIYASALNLIFSVILGKVLGLEGILLATVIARVLTNIWFEPYKLFSIYFKKNVTNYYIKQIFQVVIIILSVICINKITSFIHIENELIHFLIKGIICVLISNIMIILCIFRTSEFKELLSVIRRTINVKKRVLTSLNNL